jgi:hypothetical protein
MCKSVSVNKAVQKTAVGGAKNGGSGLEKNPTPTFRKFIFSVSASQIKRLLLL